MQQRKRRTSANSLDPKLLAQTKPEKFEMADLVRTTGVLPRQIRYWISIHAVDKPVGRSRGARYSEVHVQQVINVRERLNRGEKLQAIAHRRRNAPDRIVENSRWEGMTDDGATSSIVDVWRRIFVTDNLYIYQRATRSNLEIVIVNEMRRVANSMLNNAKKLKTKKDVRKVNHSNRSNNR